MSVAEKLEKLVRRIPGVAGYQDAATSRETDRVVRLRLAAGLEEAKRAVEDEQRRRTEAHQLRHLALLGRLTTKLDKLTNTVRYASRGYRGVFDSFKLTQEKLDELYRFDLAMLDEVEALRTQARALAASHDDHDVAASADAFDRALDTFEVSYNRRARILEDLP